MIIWGADWYQRTYRPAFEAAEGTISRKMGSV